MNFANGAVTGAFGNILSKSDTGTYSYGMNLTTGAGPHALTSIATSLGCNQSGGCTVDGLTNPTYAYDANGNMTSGAGRTVSYTSFNMTKTVTVGASSNSVTLAYDPDHARSRQTSTVGSVSTVTLYMNDAAANVMAENVKVGTAASQWKNYIVADGHAVAQRQGSGSTVTMTYFVLDHLGSVAVITDANGQTLKDSNNVETGRQFFDVWGRMRNADGSPDTSCVLPANSAATRGYTNQEQITAVCLDNYNARLYDPQVGRFLTADPSDGSGLNRYRYVGDNPLSLTDPTGLCFLGCFWKSPTGKAVIDIVLVIVLHEYALPLIEEQLAVTVADVANIAASAGIAGYVTTGRLDSALIQSAEAVAMYGVGQYVDGLEKAHILSNVDGGILRIGLHGLVGGLASAVGHGGFVSGFMAAGFGAAADTIDTGELPVDVITHAVAGGVGSVLGGGKFANGAVTGAFGYLFNDLASKWGNNGAKVGTVLGGGLGGTAAVVGEGACVVVTEGGCSFALPEAGLPVIAGGVATGGFAGAWSGYKIGWALGSIVDWLNSGTASQSNSEERTRDSAVSPMNPDKPSDKAIKNQCIQMCYPILEEPEREHGTRQWDFDACVKACIEEKQKYWGH